MTPLEHQLNHVRDALVAGAGRRRARADLVATTRWLRQLRGAGTTVSLDDDPAVATAGVPAPEGRTLRFRRTA